MFSTVLHLIPTILGVIFIFNLIIIVHELGHFLAARWRGLVIEEFGVWFGKPLWKKKFNGVWYSLGTIPAGGFVKLPQLALKTIEGDSETAPEDLPPIRPLDKIIVAFAGPLFSFLLALAFACEIWAVGKPYHREDNSTVIGMVGKDSPAEKAGLRPGDKILTIDGKPVSKFLGPVDSIMWAVMSSEGDQVHFVIERNGEQMAINSGWMKEETAAWRRKPLRKVGIGQLIVPEIGALDKGGPGEKAGLRKGDVVTAVNGASILGLSQLATAVQETPPGPLELTIRRDGQTTDVRLSPDYPTPNPKLSKEEANWPNLGIEWGSIQWDHPTPFRQVIESVQAIGNMLRSATSMKSDVKVQHFSGPIGIMNLYRQILLSEQPLQYAIAFSVFFNVNLALINMLPLPVLDGGHITVGLIELIRRRPVRNLRIMEIFETACVVLILGFMAYVTFYDVGDLIPHSSPAAAHAPPAVR